jgi:hypothetical protein
MTEIVRTPVGAVQARSGIVQTEVVRDDRPDDIAFSFCSRSDIARLTRVIESPLTVFELTAAQLWAHLSHHGDKEAGPLMSRVHKSCVTLDIATPI